VARGGRYRNAMLADDLLTLLRAWWKIGHDRFQQSEPAATEPEKVACPRPDPERPATVQTSREAAETV
jgi:hypothetical protein